MQLVAYGAQDIYLTGNPQITFFKVVYRRHTNFSMESIEQTFNGTPDWGRKVTCTISRNGDLIHRVYLQVQLPEIAVNEENRDFHWINWVGHKLIKSAEVEIGGQRIDKHYGDWLHIWNELSQQPGLQSGYARMVGNAPALVYPVQGEQSKQSTTLYIPLQFWFCKNPGLALPLIALQYHEVKINLEFDSWSNLTLSKPRGNDSRNGNWPAVPNSGEPVPMQSASLWVDYIYLDTDERRRFAQVSHEYLIEQLQHTGDETVSSRNTKIKLNFNHPVKELVWVVHSKKNEDRNQWSNFSDIVDNTFLTGNTQDELGGGLIDSNLGTNIPVNTVDNELGMFEPTELGTLNEVGNTIIGEDLLGRVDVVGNNPTEKAKLQLNGHDRFAEREGSYFNYVQPYQHHTNVPALGINVYSFGLKPEEHQPSGTCNMSRIDNVSLNLTLSQNTFEDVDANGNTKNVSAKVKVYATNYNVLRIMSGMGGLAYSN